MKKNLTLLILCFFVVIGYAQKFEITSNNPEYIKFGSFSSALDKEAHVLLKNIYSSDLQLYWSTKFIKGTEDWHWHVCDMNLCYLAGLNECPDDSPNLLMKDSTGLFIFALEDGGIEGAGIYEFCFWVKGEKESSTQCMKVHYNEISDAVDDIDNLDAIKVFPNPASEFFSLTDATGIGSIEIYTVLGSKVKSFNVTSNGSYNIADLQDGLYITHLITPKGRKVKSMSLRVQ